MNTGNLILIGVSVGVAVTLSITYASGDDIAQVPAAWTTPGTAWFVQVTQYSQGWALGISDPQKAEEAQKPKVQYQFGMRVTVLESMSKSDRRIAQIQFIALDDAPDFIRGKVCILELDASTGEAIAIKELAHNNGVAVEAVGTIGIERVLDTPIYGFPIEWIITASDINKVPSREEDRSVIKEEGGSFKKKLRRTVIPSVRRQVVEVEAATVWPEAQPYRRVLQTWVPGEGWWRNYKRYIQGHLDLEATLMDGKGE